MLEVGKIKAYPVNRVTAERINKETAFDAAQNKTSNNQR